MSCDHPLIGITALERPGVRDRECVLEKAYVEAIVAAGGIPVLVPVHGPVAVVSHLQGLLLSGDPRHEFPDVTGNPGLRDQDPARFAWEEELVRAALAADLPILGICRGLQVLATVSGGGLEPAAPAHIQPDPDDRPTHLLALAGDSLLARAVGGNKIETNSFHCQAVRDVPPSFRVVGFAGDGTVEAMESRRGWIVAVQSHPERLLFTVPAWRGLFRAFVEAAANSALWRMEMPFRRSAGFAPETPAETTPFALAEDD